MTEEEYAVARIEAQQKRGREHGDRWAREQTEPLTNDLIFAASEKYYPQNAEDFIAMHNLSAGFEDGAAAVMKERRNEEHGA